jgi:hypothetical protein
VSLLQRLVVVTVAVIGVVAVPGVAHADPAGPTDYRTTITSIEPATDAIDVDVVGGDAFLRIAVAPGHEVIILGYDAEPYLRILADGVIEQNRRSFATYYNEERYGRTDVPDIVDNDAEPDWEPVGVGGVWAWHDHRAHWMGNEPPIGLEPGESLPPQIVPIVVDGVPVEIAVRITLEAAPSLVPVVFGGVIGLGLALLGVLLGPATTGLVMLLLGAGALVVGAAQYTSLPAETGRLLAWWLLPAIAVVAIAIAIATYGRSRFALLGLTAVAAAQGLVWAFQRRAGLTRAILPTELPGGFDRFVTAAVLAGSSVVLAATLRRLFAAPARAD